MKIFSVHDKKAGYYMNPMYFKTPTEAIRAFEQGVTDEKTQLNKYPNDFTLVQLGEFNQDTGKIQTLSEYTILSNGADFI